MPLTMKDVVAKGLAVIVDPNGGIEATPREPQPPGAPGHAPGGGKASR